MASIKDGRYNEQSFRLNGLTNIANHNIVYIIEGIYERHNATFGRDKELICSLMFSLQFYKGFSVIRTMSVDETAFYLCNSIKKLTNELKGKKRSFYYANEISIPPSIGSSLTATATGNTTNSYVHVIKKVKKENITVENIQAVMLSQIPGISSNIAETIISIYGTIPELVSALKENRDCLVEITYKGTTRKIPKNIGAKLSTFLLNGINPPPPTSPLLFF